uniref:Serine aminopeptidase S33 domain-containing protein n=1 Tax=Oryza brachyantha TaxID=4533 RepID=J3LAS7_ORYBR
MAPPPATKYFWGDSPEPDEYYASLGLRHAEAYYQSPRGRLFTHSFHPLSASHDGDVRGVVFMTHGYGSDSSWMFQSFAISYARWGYAVFCADLLGHGRSEGVRGYLGDMESVAAAALSFFLSVRKSGAYASLPAFLLGESMGGAAAMLAYLRSPPDAGWTGLILSAPLLVIPDDMYPSRVRLFLYGLLFGLADTWAVMPDKKMVGKSIRNPEKMRVTRGGRGAAAGGDDEGARPRDGAAAGQLRGGDGAVPGGARHRRWGDLAGGFQDAVRARGQRGQELDPLRRDVPLAHPG